MYTVYRYIQCYGEMVKTNDIHIFAHNFLNIQLIFNQKKVLESWDLEYLTISPNVVYVEAFWKGQK